MGRPSPVPSSTGGRSVLVVDDEPGLLDLAGQYLRKAGYTVRLAATGERALAAVATQMPDMVILDLRLPDIPGEEVCTKIRRTSDVPILMLTAKSSEEDRLRGLSLGADDYLVKPFSPRELVARVRAILRRSDSTSPLSDVLPRAGGRLVVDLVRREARLDDQPLGLTQTELRVLATLARYPGRAYTRFELLEAAQGPDIDTLLRTIDVHVKNLRRKLDTVASDAGAWVQTVYGVGYRFDDQDEDLAA